MKIGNLFKRTKKAEISSYKIGGLNKSGEKIVKIFIRSEDLVVYEIESNNIVDSIQVDINPNSKEREEIIRRYNAISHKRKDVEAILYKARREASNYKNLLAVAIVEGLTGSPELANLEFEHLENRIENEYKYDLTSRSIYYFGIAFFCFLIMPVSTILFFIYGESQDYYAALIAKTFALVSFSAIGGLLSVSLRIKEIELEKDVASGWFFMYGIERGVVSLLCGLVIYIMVQGDLVLGYLIENPMPIQNTMQIIVLIILAGFSEKYVPSILRNMEKEKEEKITLHPVSSRTLAA